MTGSHNPRKDPRQDPRHAPRNYEPDRVRQGFGSILFVVALCIFITFLGTAENVILLVNQWLEAHL